MGKQNRSEKRLDKTITGTVLLSSPLPDCSCGTEGQTDPISGSDIVIIGILLSPAKLLGLKQNVCCVNSSNIGQYLP